LLLTIVKKLQITRHHRSLWWWRFL